MSSLLKQLPPFKYLLDGLKDPLDDLVDRISSPISVFVFAIFLAIHTAGLTFAEDFSCVFPAQYQSWVPFARAYCYVQPFSYLNDDLESPRERIISYFPWVSMALFVQAFGFFAPKIFWHFAARHSELDYLTVMNHTRGMRKSIGEDLHGNIKRMTNFLARHMGSCKHKTTFFVLRSPIVLLYLLKKWLYFFNAALQFYLIIHFVGDGSWAWGVHTFIYAYSGFNKFSYIRSANDTRLPTSPNFPTFTYCQVPFLVDGRQESDVVSCILTINYLTEKIYVIAYFWILMVAISSFLSALYNTIYYLYPAFRIKFVIARVQKNKHGVTEWRANDFLNNFLHADGLLAIHLIDNCDRILSEKFLCELWDKWEEHRTKSTYSPLPFF